MIGNTTSTPLAWSTDYYIWASCSNNIPYSTNFANVTLVYNFNTGNNPSTPNNTTPNNTNINNTNANSTNNTGTNPANTTNKTSGSYISYGIALLMSLLFIF